jgi:diguanylate cyclase (GGDEF)-like protein
MEKAEDAMIQLDSRQLLQSVVSLAQKPDVRAFEMALIATLGKIISARAIELFAIRENPEVPNQKMTVHVELAEDDLAGHERAAVAIETDADFLECLRTGRKVVSRAREGSGARIVHPLKTGSGVVGFLVIECDAEDPRDQDLVSILLEFYTSFVSILKDNQHDKLTGLLNRKTFDDKVLRIIASQRSPGRRDTDSAAGYCLAMLDIDHFKRVNDKFGHLYGDEVLLLFARLMIEAFRGGDLLFRIGGEEFVVILKDVDLDRSLLVFERFRQTVESFAFPQLGKVTTSIGASLITAADLPAMIIDRADKALYYAKNNGRNRVFFYEKLVAEGKLSAAAESGNSAELF